MGIVKSKTTVGELRVSERSWSRVHRHAAFVISVFFANENTGLCDTLLLYELLCDLMTERVPRAFAIAAFFPNHTCAAVDPRGTRHIEYSFCDPFAFRIDKANDTTTNHERNVNTWRPRLWWVHAVVQCRTPTKSSACHRSVIARDSRDLCLNRRPHGPPDKKQIYNWW